MMVNGLGGHLATLDPAASQAHQLRHGERDPVLRGWRSAGHPASGNFRCRRETRPPIMDPAISLLADNKSGRTAMTSSALKATLLGGLAAFTITGSALAGPKVEVLHYWTSGGESKAVLELKK